MITNLTNYSSIEHDWYMGSGGGVTRGNVIEKRLSKVHSMNMKYEIAN